MASNSLGLVVVACVTILAALLSTADGGIITMNWGRNSFQRLVPSMVVDLLLQNNITAARVYTAQEDILMAFAGSGIQLTIGIFNFAPINSLAAARKWVQIKKPHFTSANIRNIIMGNSVFMYNVKNITMLTAYVDSLKYMQDAINEAGYGKQVKATFAINEQTLKPNWTRPSDAEFKDELKDVMNKALGILDINNSPLMIEIFPISFTVDNGMDFDFSFMDGKTRHPIIDVNGLVYNNVIAFLYDSFLTALKKIGHPNVKVTIGHVGWPTDGYVGANATTAERFYKSLLPWVKNDGGTPIHKGPIDVSIHSLTDENKMPYAYPFARHWGIYTTYGDPKFKIDLCGQGRDIYPTKAKGIMKMPERWCVYVGNISDSAKVKRNFDEACNKGDCTSIASGGSCSKLTFEQNVSYAFNMYFQSKFQDETACVWEGLGKVVTENPSVRDCIFPVEVVKGQQDQIVLSEGNTIHGYRYGNLILLLLVFLMTVVWN